MAMAATFDTERFIGEVERRPCLWCKADPEYSDRDAKADAWAEVAREVFPDWDQLPSEERVEKGNDIRRRWRSLKDSFARELKIKRSEKESGQPKKRKTYLFYDFLLFLKNNHPDRKNTRFNTKTECADDSTTDNQSGEEANTEISTAPTILPSLLLAGKKPNEVSTPSDPTPKRQASNEPPTLKKISSKRRNADKTSTSTDRKDNHRKNDIDEDKAFFLSLLPSIRKFNDQQKMDLRIEILNAMKRIQYHSGYPYPPNMYPIFPPVPQYNYPPPGCQNYPYFVYPSPSSSMTIPVNPFPSEENMPKSTRSDTSDSALSEASDILHFRES